MIRNLVPPGGYGAMRVKAKVAFDYTLPDGETGTVESNEFFLYRGSFAERNGSPAPVLDRDARTITMDFNYHLVEGGEIDPAKVTWTEHHLYGKDKGDTGDDGKSFTVVIESTNGSVFRMPDVSTTLFCRVYVNGGEVTDAIDESAFRWTRKTDDAQSDESWNSSSKAIGHRTVDITPDDCHGRTVFDCSVDLEI